MSKSFKRWTEEERRAHIRAKTLAYKGRQEDRLTPREKEIKEMKRKQREEVRKSAEEGSWLIIDIVKPKPDKVQIKTEVKMAKNMFAGLDDSEEEVDKVEKTWTKKAFNWADSDDE